MQEKKDNLKVDVLTNMIPPYRLPAFLAFARTATVKRLRVLVCVDREVDRPENWRPGRVDAFQVKRMVGPTINIKRSNRVKIIHLKFGLLVDLLWDKPDVLIIGDASWTSYLAVVLCLVARIPYIVWNETTEASRINRRSNIIRRFVFGNAKAFLASGSASSEFIKAHGGNYHDIFFARNAVDNDYYLKRRSELEAMRGDIRAGLGVGPADFVFIYVGQLIQRKKVIETLELVSKISLRRSVFFLIVGDGHLEGAIRHRAEELSFDRLKFFGQCDKEELSSLYIAADALILLSEDDPWGMVVNEALLFGKPFVATDRVGAAVEFEKCGGILLKSGDNPEQGIERVMDDLALREMAQGAVARGELPSGETMAQAMAEASCYALR